MNIETLKSQLKSLRLPTASGELEQVLSEQKQASALSWLVTLLDVKKMRSS